jgi:ammonia channel protein AmtB
MNHKTTLTFVLNVITGQLEADKTNLFDRIDFLLPFLVILWIWGGIRYLLEAAWCWQIKDEEGRG